MSREVAREKAEQAHEERGWKHDLDLADRPALKLVGA